MKGQFSRKREITYRWWADNGEIPQSALQALGEHAWSHIDEMIPQGYSSGQLLTEVDGVEYEGWWELCEETL